jgi:hypothetical protein
MILVFLNDQIPCGEFRNIREADRFIHNEYRSGRADEQDCFYLYDRNNKQVGLRSYWYYQKG